MSMRVFHGAGTMRFNNKTNTNATTAMIVSSTVHVRNVCGTVMP